MNLSHSIQHKIYPLSAQLYFDLQGQLYNQIAEDLYNQLYNLGNQLKIQLDTRLDD
jgi:hypothetical protein